MVAIASSRKKKVPKPRETSSSQNYWVLLVVKILLVLVILLWLAPVVQSKKRRSHRKKLNRVLQNQRVDCELECSRLIPEEAMTCIFQCVSPSCYEQIFAIQDMKGPESRARVALEPGEVLDAERTLQYDSCLKDEIKNQRRLDRELERKRKRNADNGGEASNERDNFEEEETNQD